MVVYTAKQIRDWDTYTMEHEPVNSIDLMERAAQKCVDWLEDHFTSDRSYKIFCGKGNNGGDGLAIARLLYNKGLKPVVYLLDPEKKGTGGFETNLQRLQELLTDINFIQSADHFPEIATTDIIIDALFGSGLNKSLQGLSSLLVQHINEGGKTTISIDLPSGLFADQSSKGYEIIKADYTLSFQTYKTALLLAENAPFIGEVNILDIGLHPQFIEQEKSYTTLIDESLIKRIFKPRQRFAHKGNHGHALIMGGSYGKIGAVVLAATSCLRSGAGLVTIYTPKCGYNILQTSAPEAMVITDKEENCITEVPREVEKYDAIGIGPGLGTAEQTQNIVYSLLHTYNKPLIIDADALNCLSLNKEWLLNLPPHSIITPHPKEFERLFGFCENDFQRINIAQEESKRLNIIIVLKGHHTFIALPDGTAYFNNTGNAGMAKGGTGDVLTGIITSLCAQGYAPAEAAVLGVYLHGLAGDLAADALSKEAMVAGDIVRYLPESFKKVNNLINKSGKW